MFLFSFKAVLPSKRPAGNVFKPPTFPKITDYQSKNVNMLNVIIIINNVTLKFNRLRFVTIWKFGRGKKRKWITWQFLSIHPFSAQAKLAPYRNEMEQDQIHVYNYKIFNPIFSQMKKNVQTKHVLLLNTLDQNLAFKFVINNFFVHRIFEGNY